MVLAVKNEALKVNPNRGTSNIFESTTTSTTTSKNLDVLEAETRKKAESSDDEDADTDGKMYLDDEEASSEEEQEEEEDKNDDDDQDYEEIAKAKPKEKERISERQAKAIENKAKFAPTRKLPLFALRNRKRNMVLRYSSQTSSTHSGLVTRSKDSASSTSSSSLLSSKKAHDELPAARYLFCSLVVKRG